MSAKLQGHVWELDLPGGQQRVLLALADHAHDDGSKCYPGVAYLAWKTGLDRRSVQRALRELEAKEIIEATSYVTGGRGHATEFRLHLEKGDKKPPFTHAERAAPVRERAVHTPPQPLEPRTARANARANGRPRDELWDELATALGEPQTRSERGRRNKALKELRDVGATAGEVRLRISEHLRRWPDCELTATSLAANWTLLGEAKAPRQRVTGWRQVRGSHGVSLVPDPEGTAPMPAGYA